MCITIPSSANVKRARQWVLWQWLAASPLRLFLIGGGLMLLAAVGAALSGWSPSRGWTQFNLLFAVIPVLLLGPLFEFLPRLLKVTPLTYVRLALLFFLLLISQLAFHARYLWGGEPGPLYLLPLVLAWVGFLRALHDMLRFSYTELAGTASALFHLLLLAGIAGLLIAAGLVSGWLASLPAYAWTGLMPVYLFTQLGLIYLQGRRRSRGPA